MICKYWTNDAVSIGEEFTFKLDNKRAENSAVLVRNKFAEI